MPNFPIIDSHVHLYDVGRLRYGWLQGVPKINRTYVLEDFDRARGEAEVDKIVFAEVAVDPGLHLEEAAFIQSLADKDRRLAGMVAHAPLEKGPAVEGDIVALKKNRILRGIRRLIETERDPSFCLEPGFIEAIKLLPKHGLTFDICVKHWALVFGLELARRCPEVTFVLDHIGKPGIKHGLREPWWGQIVEMARLPNVVCKVSGVITEANHAKWNKEEVKPYITHVIEAFGFDRVMYGSDWTVSELTHPYPTFVDILDEVVAQANDAEKRKLYRDTAMRIYRLE
ncbi:MAG: amidohydrolase family protein [Methylobacteriaceae bacterium]|nr:amidohydrolase family protein [Methylobacteriaceae bacterium]